MGCGDSSGLLLPTHLWKQGSTEAGYTSRVPNWKTHWQSDSHGKRNTIPCSQAPSAPWQHPGTAASKAKGSDRAYSSVIDLAVSLAEDASPASSKVVTEGASVSARD